MHHFKSKILLKDVYNYAPLQKQNLSRICKTMLHINSKFLLKDVQLCTTSEAKCCWAFIPLSYTSDAKSCWRKWILYTTSEAKSCWRLCTTMNHFRNNYAPFQEQNPVKVFIRLCFISEAKSCWKNINKYVPLQKQNPAIGYKQLCSISEANPVKRYKRLCSISEANSCQSISKTMLHFRSKILFNNL